MKHENPTYVLSSWLYVWRMKDHPHSDVLLWINIFVQLKWPVVTLPLSSWPQGTTYQKTNAEIEMKKINREEFWEQAKVEMWYLCVSGSSVRTTWQPLPLTLMRKCVCQIRWCRSGTSKLLFIYLEYFFWTFFGGFFFFCIDFNPKLWKFIKKKIF